MPELELYGTATCPHTRDAREALEWKRQTFVEYDVDVDADALARLTALTGQRVVPVLVADGRVVEIGWQGRCCFVGAVAGQGPRFQRSGVPECGTAHPSEPSDSGVLEHRNPKREER